MNPDPLAAALAASCFTLAFCLPAIGLLLLVRFALSSFLRKTRAQRIEGLARYLAEVNYASPSLIQHRRDQAAPSAPLPREEVVRRLQALRRSLLRQPGR